MHPRVPENGYHARGRSPRIIRSTRHIVTGSGESAKTGAACAHRCLGRKVRIGHRRQPGGTGPGSAGVGSPDDAGSR